jgi:SNF2 family DNA or RNA helicase
MSEIVKVRLKDSPDRIGYMNLSKSRGLGKRKKVFVEFMDGRAEYFYEKYLEEVDEEETAEDMVEKGQYATIDQLRHSLTFQRLNGRLANLIYSMESTNTDFYPYQFKPVLNFLNSPSGGLLIADEVGLGKTIEAGLIWTEIRSRYEAKRLLIVCPAMLREKWRDEMQLRFGVKAEISDAKQVLDTVKAYENGSVHEFCLIASMQGMRPRRRWDSNKDEVKDKASQLARYLRDHEEGDPLFDMIIIDEAHYLKNSESMTSKLGGLLRPVTPNLLMLSATPIQTSSSDLFTLLNVLDDGSFYSEQDFDSVLAANEPLLNLKEKLVTSIISQNDFLQSLAKAKKFPILSNNRQLTHLIDNPPSESELTDRDKRSELASKVESINLLSSVVSRTRKRDVHEWRVVRSPIAEVIPMTSMEGQLYNDVTNAVREYCARYDAHEGFLLTTPQRQLCSSMPAALRAWKKKTSSLAMEMDVEDIESEGTAGVGPLVSALLRLVESYADLDELTEFDSKFKRLAEVLLKFFSDNPDEKVVLFSYFRETLNYLNERLTYLGIKPILLYGGMAETKQDIINKFKNDASYRILISSEVASEGVDLQFCRVLVNYDLPWNPMKVEQRIGRIDRLGQSAEKIIIWNLFLEDTIDQRIYERLLRRLGVFEYALGSMDGVIGEKIKKLSNSLLRGKLSVEEEEIRIDQTEQALANLKRHNDDLEDEAAGLVAHGDFILNKVKAAKELQRFITNEDLYLFFANLLNSYFSGSQLIEIEKSEVIKCELELSVDAKLELGEYLTKNKLNRNILLKEDHGRVKIVFDNHQKMTRSKWVSINQFHPFVKFLMDKKRSVRDVNSPPIATSISQYHIPEVKKGDYAFYVSRWSVQGVTTSEQLVYSVSPIGSEEVITDVKAEKLINLTVVEGKRWEEASRVLKHDVILNHIDYCRDELDDLYGVYVDAAKRSNDDRADIQQFNVNNHYERKITRLKELLKEKERMNDTRMRPANLGKLAKLESRLAEQLESFDRKRKVEHDKVDVIMGVIHVN